MRKKAICLAAALVLTALLGPVTGGAAEEGKLDVTKSCSLTVRESDSTDERFLEDLQKAEVVLDLYKVADVEKIPGYDTYSYSALGSYEGLELDKEDMKQSDWDRLAQEAAQIALADGALVKPEAGGRKPGEAIEKLDDGTDLGCGLYLLVARGSSLTDYTEYLEVPEAALPEGSGTAAASGGAEGTEELAGGPAGTEKLLVTVARSPGHTYSFKPQLISLPMKAAGEAGTAAPGPWLYQVAASLKPMQSGRYGSLEIVKTLRTYETKEPGMFVFQIEAVLDGETVYSDVESLIFTAAGQQTIRLENKFPAGAEVTVTEIYEGGSYKLETPDSRTVQISADAFVQADFVNNYSEERKGGHGIVNQFDYSGTGAFDGWEWKQSPAAGAE